MTKTEDFPITEGLDGSADSSSAHESFLRDLGAGSQIEPAQNASNDAELQSARQSLEVGLLSRLDPLQDWERLSTSRENMNEIGQRVKRGELTAQQATETFRQVERLLGQDDTTKLSQETLQKLAEQVLENAANPAGIDQGRYNTCNVTTAEVLAYSRAPEKAAALVADVALLGRYSATYIHPEHGQISRTVQIDPTPHGESLVHPNPDGMRNHASEIFQVTAVNLAYNASDDGYYRYRQVEPDVDKPWDSGERFEELSASGVYGPYVDGLNVPPNPNDMEDLARATQIASAQDKDYQRNFQTNIQPAQMALVAEIISGSRTQEILAGGQNIYAGANSELWKPLGREVASAEDLYAMLKSFANEGKFPHMVAVNAAKEPFRSEVGITTDVGPVWHNITIHGLEERKGEEPHVLVSNQWGDSSDHLNWDSGIALSRFYEAMRQ